MAEQLPAGVATRDSGVRPAWTDITALLIYLALATVILHILAGNRYGFHADELATLDDARHLAWGYPAYPPVTPFFGRLSLILFGTSLVGFRLFASLAHAITIVLAGLMARDFGGGRHAQLLAGGLSTPFAIGGGALMQYVSFDYFAWVLTAFCIVRLIRSGNPRWWLAAGASIGFGALSKYTMAFLVVSIVAGFILTDLRRHLTNKWLWMGVALSVAIFLPNLLWQWQHDFVSLDFLNHIHARDVRYGRTDSFLRDQLANLFPAGLAGLYFLFARQGKSFRIVGWMFVLAFLLFFLARGRSYYMNPAYPMIWAAGAVWFERTKLFNIAWIFAALGILLSTAFYLPLAPIPSRWFEMASSLQETYRGEIGWPELAEETARIRDTLAPADREGLGILTGGYGAAGAINLFGPRYGLPRAISGMNSLWQHGYGDSPPRILIVMGLKWELADRSFSGCRVAGRIRNRYGVQTDDMRWNADIYICGPPRVGWPEFWKHFRYFGWSHHSTERSMLAIVGRPSSIIAISNSLRRICTTRVTPAAPATPKPHKYGRPICTACAPNASAFTTSVPRRMPPSTSTGTRPPTFSTTSGKASMVAGTVSRLRAPWFDTMIPETPAFTAVAASSGLRMPLSSTGRRAKERSQSISFQLRDGSR